MHDDPAHVQVNRGHALRALGRPASSWVSGLQVHGDDVVQVARGASPHTRADGLITCDRGATLAILVGDCVPLLLVDAQARAVAAVHAGWRGTAQRIAARAALALADAAACAPGALHAALGPAIGPCCFVVDAPVAAQLAAAYADASTAIAPAPGAAGRARVDLWALNIAALVAAGVPEGQITATRTCTACSKAHFSHRRDGAPSGRQAGLIARP